MRQKTLLKIIGLMRKGLDKGLTILEISKRLKIGYRPAYNHIGEMESEGIIKINKIGSSKQCSLNISNPKTKHLLETLDIERTEDISNSREERIDDSFIRVKVFKEKEIELKEVHEHHYHHYYDYWRPYYVNPYAYPIGWPQYPTAWYSNTSGGSSLSCNANLSAQNISEEDNNPGITVKGSPIDIKFGATSYITFGDSYDVIIIRLKGTKPEGIKVEEPITVKYKKFCSCCHKAFDYSDMYCSKCGTYLN